MSHIDSVTQNNHADDDQLLPNGVIEAQVEGEKISEVIVSFSENTIIMYVCIQCPLVIARFTASTDCTRHAYALASMQ